MQISYQPTRVPYVARSVTLNYTDDGTPAKSITMFNASVEVVGTTTTAGTPPMPQTTGPWTATVSRVDGDGVVMTDGTGPLTETGTDPTSQDAAILAAATALAPRVLPVPAVTSISPASGPAAGGGTVVIAGANLIGATAVQFGGTDAASFTVDSPTQITAVTPAGTADPVDVAVTAPGGTATQPDGFTYS